MKMFQKGKKTKILASVMVIAAAAHILVGSKQLHSKHETTKYVIRANTFVAKFTNTEASNVSDLYDRPSFKESIRSWGCNRHESPLVFVHIGKAGGGSIRRRLAASAQNYSRGINNWHRPQEDNHYYPINNTARGKFCNSKYKHPHTANSSSDKVFEGKILCNATTPLGIAVACPAVLATGCMGCNDFNSKSCYTVYVGHNGMGSEFMWLPPKILQYWWKKTWDRSDSVYSVAMRDALVTLNPDDKQWCFGKKERAEKNISKQKKMELYKECNLPLASLTDDQFRRYWNQFQKLTIGRSSSHITRDDFSPVYASLPVHRVTVLREPFSWLISKFFWHSHLFNNSDCSDSSWVNKQVIESYLLRLCGIDCPNRYEAGLMSLGDVEAQVESNLRRSFSVIGLLNETETFYTMMSKRIAYVNFTVNLSEIKSNHSSINKKNAPAVARCKMIYSNETFREKFKRKVPSLAILERLYLVGVEVNRFQQQELDQCPFR